MHETMTLEQCKIQQINHVQFKFKLLSHKIMEDVASISASPVDCLLPAISVDGLLMKQCPKLVLAACG